MARLIDAEALGINKAKREIFNDPKYADGWNSAIEVINNAPTVDAVPVVRCKDCWFYQSDNSCGWNGSTGWYPHDYCSYGKPKGNMKIGGAGL